MIIIIDTIFSHIYDRLEFELPINIIKKCFVMSGIDSSKCRWFEYISIYFKYAANISISQTRVRFVQLRFSDLCKIYAVDAMESTDTAVGIDVFYSGMPFFTSLIKPPLVALIFLRSGKWQATKIVKREILRLEPFKWINDYFSRR